MSVMLTKVNITLEKGPSVFTLWQYLLCVTKHKVFTFFECSDTFKVIKFIL